MVLLACKRGHIECRSSRMHSHTHQQCTTQHCSAEYCQWCSTIPFRNLPEESRMNSGMIRMVTKVCTVGLMPSGCLLLQAHGSTHCHLEYSPTIHTQCMHTHTHHTHPYYPAWVQCKALNHSNWPNQGAFGHSHTNRWTDAQADTLNFLSVYIQTQQAYNLYCTYTYSLQPLGILHTCIIAMAFLVPSCLSGMQQSQVGLWGCVRCAGVRTYPQVNGRTILDTHHLTHTVHTYIIIALFIYTCRYNDCKSGVLSPSCPPTTIVQGNLHFPLDPISYPMQSSCMLSVKKRLACQTKWL